MAFSGIKNLFGDSKLSGGAPYEWGGTPPYAGSSGPYPGATPPIAPTGAQRPMPAPQEPQLPKAPPSARSTSPWAKENLSRTLLDIGSAFLSEDDFFQGMGKAAQGIAGRMDALKKSPNKVEYGGPNNQFEITTDEMGNRTIREVPEFAKAIEAERASKRPTLSPRDTLDMRARVIAQINRLPESQRPAAYADFMQNPGKYGGIDTSGMPSTYDPTYGTIVGAMGQSVPQYEAGMDRDRAYDRGVIVSDRRLEQGERRLNKPTGKGGGRGRGGALRAAPKLPSGFILD